MSQSVPPVEIPRRALFKAAEVCELVKVQPYVLRSWEAEFPELGVAKSEGGPRVYRRADVERVVRIKHLLLVEGLTLAGVRRRIEEEEAPVGADRPALDELIGRNARERLTAVKQGLRSLLEMLGQNGGRRDLRLAVPAPAAGRGKRPAAMTRASRTRAEPRGASRPQARRKRSA
jgi:DNA-binding transcriptional MerR regulator